MSKKILVINGPNLEMLGKRDKSTYGDFSLESLEKLIMEAANTLGCQVVFFQKNIEKSKNPTCQQVLRKKWIKTKMTALARSIDLKPPRTIFIDK